MPYNLTQSQVARELNVTPALINQDTKKDKLDGAWKIKKKNGKPRKFYDLKKTKECYANNRDPQQDFHKKNKLADISVSEKQKTIKDSGVEFSSDSLSELKKISEKYKIALKKLEFEEKSKRLLPAEEIKAAWIQFLIAAKTRILGIRSKVAPLVNEYFEDIDDRESILGLIDSVAREALEELSRFEL